MYLLIISVIGYILKFVSYFDSKSILRFYVWAYQFIQNIAFNILPGISYLLNNGPCSLVRCKYCVIRCSLV